MKKSAVIFITFAFFSVLPKVGACYSDENTATGKCNCKRNSSFQAKFVAQVGQSSEYKYETGGGIPSGITIVIVMVFTTVGGVSLQIACLLFRSCCVAAIRSARRYSSSRIGVELVRYTTEIAVNVNQCIV